MSSRLHLYIAEEEDAEAIGAGEYHPPPGCSLSLPGDIDTDDLSALNCVLCGCRIDPDLSIMGDELLADGRDAIVYRVLPEFVERLSLLEQGGSKTVLREWASFLSDGEDEEGWWTEAKAQRLLRRLSGLSRRARSLDLPLLLAMATRG